MQSNRKESDKGVIRLNEEPIVFNQKKLLIDLAMRNALRYARGEVKYTRDLHDQLVFGYQNSSPATKEVMKQVFKMVEFDEP